jgi:1-deoxy-D-xylulose 5-phosphate reductoisomerase
VTLPRTITILGATGSVGQSTLDLVKRAPEQFAVEVLTANTNVADLAELAIATKAKLAVVADEGQYATLRDALAGTGIEAAAGQDALLAAAQRPVDWTMAAIVGCAGLPPVMEARWPLRIRKHSFRLVRSCSTRRSAPAQYCCLSILSITPFSSAWTGLRPRASLGSS